MVIIVGVMHTWSNIIVYGHLFTYDRAGPIQTVKYQQNDSLETSHSLNTYAAEIKRSIIYLFFLSNVINKNKNEGKILQTHLKVFST